MMLWRYNANTEEGGMLLPVPPPPKKLLNSTSDLDIVSEMTTILMVFKFRKQEKVRWN